MFEEKNVLKIDEIVTQLEKQLSPALYEIGFLEASIANPIVYEKTQNSFSGHAAAIAIQAVATKLVMFTTRSWDKNGNSIRNFLKFVHGQGQEIALLAPKDGTNQTPRQAQKIQSKIDHLICVQNETLSGAAFKSLLLLRNEHIAHPLEGKSDISKRLKRDGAQINDATYDDILLVSNLTAKAICDVIYVWRRTLKNPRSAIDIAKRCTDEFWYQLPILSETERPI